MMDTIAGWTVLILIGIYVLTNRLAATVCWLGQRDQQRAADDWAAANDYGPVALYGMADETPIYTATTEHIARMEAAEIDDEWARICDATGGAA